MLANSHKTAIARRGPSAPCVWLAKQERLLGPVLDWGCGRGADVRFIRNAYGYDPHYQPKLPDEGELFNTVLCTYVLNTIPEYHDRVVVIQEIMPYLAVGGWLYVTIRANPDSLKGWTSKGTWQVYVGDQLEMGGFRCIRKVRDYEIWGWQKSPDWVE